ncbi:MAG TPA: pyridoxamine 5'-phosphate oxidase [Gaiellaceae bacterium]|nr:pyridoxamine 5'-phosphate oxidase [Gaiellaceae bacterium]
MMSELHRRDLVDDPQEQFRRWFAEMEGLTRAPEAMALATAAADGRPSVRMVLLKQADEDGLVFFSHYSSRKGRELEENPQAALLFHWDALGRQVRIEGAVARVSEDESDAYFATRPLGARLSAIASPQSRVVESRADLEARVAELAAAGAPARPPWWGGFRLVPDAWEFWQHRDNRLHDRFRYRREGGAWIVERLGP